MASLSAASESYNSFDLFDNLIFYNTALRPELKKKIVQSQIKITVLTRIRKTMKNAQTLLIATLLFTACNAVQA